IRKRLREVGGPARDAVLVRNFFDLIGIAPDQDRVGDQARAVTEQKTALVANREYGTDQVLVESHAAGHAVHNDANPSGTHTLSSAAFRKSRFFASGPNHTMIIISIIRPASKAVNAHR